MRRLLLCLSLLLMPALVVMTTPACDDGPIPRECTDIPTGGCPLQRGVSCADVQCAAVYLCRPNNVWELHEMCPARDAAPRSTSDASTSPDAPITPSLDASIDAPPGAFGGPGCASLQAPECSLGLALSCGGCCGCEDLFVCENGGWTLWGVCGDGGIQRF